MKRKGKRKGLGKGRENRDGELKIREKEKGWGVEDKGKRKGMGCGREGKKYRDG